MPVNTHLCSDELLGLWLAGVRELLSEAQVHCVPRLGTGALLVVLELYQENRDQCEDMLKKVHKKDCFFLFFTLYEEGHVQEFTGSLSLQFVWFLSVLCQRAVPVHAALAEAFDEHAVRSYPHQHPFLQVGQETAHGFSDARGQADGVWMGEEHLLGFTRPVDALVPHRSTALQDEAAVRRRSHKVLHQFTMIEQTHLQTTVYKHTHINTSTSN